MAITTQMRTDVAGLYTALFGRAPESGGLGYWVSQLDAGQSVAQVAQTMYSLDVTRAVYPAFLTNGEIIAKFYTNVLGRTGDAEGLAYWTAKLDAGQTKGTVISQMITAVTAYAGTDATALTSKNLFNNKVTVGLNYAVTLGGNDVAVATSILALVTADAASVATANAAASATAGLTFTLTSGVDTFVGGTGNDTFTANSTAAGASTLTALDSIDGGAGTNTLNVSDVSAAFTIPASATVKNIQTANITGGGTVTGDVSGWTGLTKLTVSEFGGTGAGGLTAAAGATVTVIDGNQVAGAIAVNGGSTVSVTATGATTAAATITVGAAAAPAGAVTITQSTAATSTTHTNGAIAVTGGTTVAVTENLLGTAATATITGGAVTVTGTAATTTVSVTQTAAATAAAGVTGVVDGAVTIADANAGSATKAATINSVTLANYGASTISSNALATLSLSGTAGTLGITSGLTTETVTTLGLTVNALSGANTITDVSNHFKTINVTTAGTAKSTVANIADTAATALTVAGTQVLALTSTAGLTGLKTVTVSGAAGVSADVSALGTVTGVDASGSSGANTVTIDATKATYAGGSGVDTVTIAAAPTKAINGGAGTADVLVVNIAGGFNASGNANISGFETLSLGALATGSYDATGFTNLTQGAVAAAVTYSNVAAGANLAMTATPGFATTYTLKDATGTSDALTVSMSAAGAIAGNTLTAAGIEAITLSATDTTAAVAAGATADSLTLVATAAKTITVTGNTTLTLTNTGNTAVTSIDASGMTGGIVVTTAGTVAETVKGGATANTLTAAAGTTADTLVGGAAADTLTNNAGLDILTGGAGADKFVIDTVGANVNTYSTVTDAAKTDIISLKSQGAEALTGASMTASKITLASTAVFQDYANAVVNAGGDASTNGKIGWFVFNGDTYIVESLHNAVTTANFTNGTDLVVKLTGVIDLTTATFASGAGALDATITLV